MTTGQMLFYSGVGLLVLTILLAIVFLVKKPQYIPEQVGVGPDGSNQTQKLRNGYPTDPVTRGKQEQQATELLVQDGGLTQMQTGAATELMTPEQPASVGATESL